MPDARRLDPPSFLDRTFLPRSVHGDADPSSTLSPWLCSCRSAWPPRWRSPLRATRRRRSRTASRTARRSPWRSRPTARGCSRPTRRRARSRWSTRIRRRCSTRSPPGEKPAGVAISDRRPPRGRHALVRLRPRRSSTSARIGLEVAGRVEVGPEPRGVVLTHDGKTAYVAVGREQRGRPRRPRRPEGHGPADRRPRAARDRPVPRRLDARSSATHRREIVSA